MLLMVSQSLFAFCQRTIISSAPITKWVPVGSLFQSPSLLWPFQSPSLLWSFQSLSRKWSFQSLSRKCPLLLQLSKKRRRRSLLRRTRRMCRLLAQPL